MTGLFLSLGVPFLALAETIEHHYDKAGRLIQSNNQESKSVRYNYDAVGNIVYTGANDKLAILDFTPDRGLPGTKVVITGNGFDKVAANNTVKFNGVNATVSSATPSLLTVTVPTNAVTGMISVATTKGTATSSRAFTVGEDILVNDATQSVNLKLNEPITLIFTGVKDKGYSLGFTGVTGKFSVTVNKPSGEKLVDCSMQAAGRCMLPFLPTAGTYKVTFQATGADAAFNVSLLPDKEGTLAHGVPMSFVSERVGRAGTYSFQATQSGGARLMISEGTLAGGNTIEIYRPDGVLWQTRLFNASRELDGKDDFISWDVPLSGVYRARVIPPNNNVTGRMVLRYFNAMVDVIVANAAAKSYSLMPNQGLKLSFTGTAGDLLGVGVKDVSASVNSALYVKVVKPDGSLLDNFTVSYASAPTGYALSKLPVSGKYTFQIDPADNASNFAILLTPDATGTLVDGGAALTFSPTRIGQAASYSFNGVFGKNATLKTSGNTFVGQTRLAVFKPDGNQLATSYMTSSGGNATSGEMALSDIPATATYSLRVVPPSGKLGTLSVQYNTIANTTQTLTPNAAKKSVTLAKGQIGNFTFSGKAGDRLGLGITNLSVSGGSLSFTLYQPDGSSLDNSSISGSFFGRALPILTQDGTYTLRLNPQTGSATFDLELLKDIQSTLEIGKAASVFTPAKVGQSASYSLTVAAPGKNIKINLTNNTVVGSTQMIVYRPDNTVLNSSYLSYSSGAATSQTMTLNRVTGNFSIRLIPPFGKTGSLSISLTEDQDANLVFLGELTSGSAAKSGSIAAGQVARYSLSLTKDARVGFALTEVTRSGTGAINVNIYKPDGNLYSSFGVSGSSTSSTNHFPTSLVPETGTYTVEVNPSGQSATYKLWVTPEQKGTIATTGTPVTFNANRPGLSASYTFTGTAGQNATLLVSENTIPGGTYAYVYAPNGSQVGSAYSSYSSGAGTSSTLQLKNLPATGTYEVRVMPYDVKTGSLKISVTKN
ncbi:MAG: IPT/TIG domain-containing protein [Burkholderiales bacterium]|nr:IPT/TIG domain-containing protein [Burkholderiales bacterium]